MTDLSKMTTFEITALHNSLTVKPVKKFETRTIAIARTQKLVDAKAKADVVAAEAAAYEAQLAEVKRLNAAEAADNKVRAELQRRDAVFSKRAAKATKARIGEDIGVQVGGPAPKAAAPVEAAKPAVAKAAKPAKPAPADKPRKVSEFGLSGTKLALLKMMQRQEGVSEAEGCEALSWAKCTATILKVATHVEPQGLTMHRWRGETGKTRYRLVPSNSGI